MRAREQQASDRRLDSWKEIAAFFGRDERTVKRWEKERALPVHRLPGGARSGVFAYATELSEWLKDPVPAESVPPEENSGEGVAVGNGSLGNVVPKMKLSPTLVRTPAIPATSSKFHVARILGLIVAILLGFIILKHQIPRSPTSASARNNAAVARRPNPEAEELYLKGRYFWNKRTPEDLNKAVDLFTQAIVRDPSYAQAYVGLADCYNLLREYSVMPATEAYPRAFAAAQKAVELDNQSSAAHASLAFVLFYGKWDVSNAEQEFKRAIDLDPNNAVAHHWYATYLMTIRRFPESLTEIERAQALDPTSTSILADKGNALFLAGRRDEAVTLLKQMEVTEPAFLSPHLYLRDLYLAEADYPNFVAESRKDALLLHDNAALAITASAERGLTAGGAKVMFENMLQTQKKYYAQGLVPPTAIARTCALLGNKDEAVQYLKIAYDQHDELLLSVKNYPALNSLHQDSAYRDLLTRMNLPIEN
jgi:Tfp pilus assembly protein PilF